MKLNWQGWLLIAGLIAFALFLLCGCGTTKTVSDQTTTTITEHSVIPPAVKDTGTVHWVDTTPHIDSVIDQIHKDSSWAAVKVEAKTKHGKVTYYPHTDSIFVEMQPDPVKVTNTVTERTMVNVKEPGFFEKAWTFIKQFTMLIIIGCAGIFLFTLYIRFFKK